MSGKNLQSRSTWYTHINRIISILALMVFLLSLLFNVYSTLLWISQFWCQYVSVSNDDMFISDGNSNIKYFITEIHSYWVLYFLEPRSLYTAHFGKIGCIQHFPRTMKNPPLQFFDHIELHSIQQTAKKLIARVVNGWLESAKAAK